MLLDMARFYLFGNFLIATPTVVTATFRSLSRNFPFPAHDRGKELGTEVH